ncbi:hypothetical protein [Jiangella asiatica]|uniref:Peptidylamidoglycolate lyase n=1 Tax=Jiangella asiatica TaxID=2530372 RepID=A0A4R5CQP4_9ACTN|nr:hypothetical protein [Jiangella asiatica]TDE01151.1 hypothetical protein E1269_23600 [Jiangella asiatica]
MSAVPDAPRVPHYVRDPAWTAVGDGLGFREIADVAVDTDGVVYVYGREDAAVVRLDRTGRELDRWGVGAFIRPHGLTVSPYEDAVFLVDDYSHSVRKYTKGGTHLMTIEAEVTPDFTGYVRGDSTSVRRAGPPFCYPTALAFDGPDELLVTDGYGNARVHRFTADGLRLASWGEPGSGPGEFSLPHGLLVDADRILVADRENDRVQVFDPAGGYLDEWADCRRPANVLRIAGGVYAVAELGRVNRAEGTERSIEPEAPAGRISIRDADGRLLSEFTPQGEGERDTWFAPHGIAVDGAGDLYVAETYVTFFRGHAPRRPTLHKFTAAPT